MENGNLSSRFTHHVSRMYDAFAKEGEIFVVHLRFSYQEVIKCYEKNMNARMENRMRKRA